MIEHIHWLGNASFKFTNGKIVYIDPFEIKDLNRVQLGFRVSWVK